jgi:hypothetical protein
LLGILIHEILFKLSQNTVLKEKLHHINGIGKKSGLLRSSVATTEKQTMPPNSLPNMLGKGNRSKVNKLLGTSTVSEKGSNGAMRSQSTATSSNQENVDGDGSERKPPRTLIRASSTGGSNATTTPANSSSSSNNDNNGNYLEGILEVDNEAYELRLKATMNGLSLDLGNTL